MSYNILADVYASTEYAAHVLYRYCKREALDGEYRQCRIVRELFGYHDDVMCLQEVGARMYAEFIQPSLAQAGCLQLKAGTVSIQKNPDIRGVLLLLYVLVGRGNRWCSALQIYID